MEADLQLQGPTEQCDEYPFASTLDADDYYQVSRCVPQRQNSSMGFSIPYQNQALSILRSTRRTHRRLCQGLRGLMPRSNHLWQSRQRWCRILLCVSRPRCQMYQRSKSVDLQTSRQPSHSRRELRRNRYTASCGRHLQAS